MLNRYKEVVMLNEELIAACHVRRATQEHAVASLKTLHTILQQAARLRGQIILYLFQFHLYNIDRSFIVL